MSIVKHGYKEGDLLNCSVVRNYNDLILNKLYNINLLVLIITHMIHQTSITYLPTDAQK